MLINSKVTQGKLDENTSNIISALLDGKYIVSIKRVNEERTKKEWTQFYFALVDEVVMHSGYTRYEIHEMIKQNYKVETTRDFSSGDWEMYMINFRIFIFNKFDIVI